MSADPAPPAGGAALVGPTIFLGALALVSACIAGALVGHAVIRAGDSAAAAARAELQREYADGRACPPRIGEDQLVSIHVPRSAGEPVRCVYSRVARYAAATRSLAIPPAAQQRRQ